MMDRAVHRVRAIKAHLLPSHSSFSSLSIEGAAGSSKGKKSPDDIVIVSAVRTPIGRAKKGTFKDTHPTDLLVPVLQAAVERVGLEPKDVNDIIVGNVLMPGGFATQARMASFLAGFPSTVSVSTCNRQCSSGLQAVAHVAAAIGRGYYDIGIAAGVESMSAADMAGSLGALNDKIFQCEDAKACLIPMGITSENVAAKFGVSRETQDKMAEASHTRALRAQKEGRFKNEIVAVTTTVLDADGNAKQVTLEKDEGPRAGTSLEGLAKLAPAFKKDGSTTAGNSSQVSDGAAAVLLMKRSTAEKRRLPILGSFVTFAVAGVPPEIMGIGPAAAIPVALANAGLTLKDIDVFEINEAFASQASYSVQHLGIPMDKVNPNGGAIALGHPLGCTGARQVSTLLYELHRTKGKYGVTSMCIGTGMGAAAVFMSEQ